MLAEIGEVLGNFHLRRVQDFLEMTNAERPLRQQVQDPQSRFIAEAFVNVQQFHARLNIPL